MDASGKYLALKLLPVMLLIVFLIIFNLELEWRSNGFKGYKGIWNIRLKDFYADILNFENVFMTLYRFMADNMYKTFKRLTFKNIIFLIKLFLHFDSQLISLWFLNIYGFHDFSRKIFVRDMFFSDLSFLFCYF